MRRARRPDAVPAAGALLAALAVGACGSGHHSISNETATGTESGSGQKSFSAPGMAIHFRYPASFHSVELAQSKRIAGNTGQASHAALGTGPFDLLIVTRFPKRPIPVTARNITQLKPQFDSAVGSALGRTVSSTVATYGGRPALSYPPAPVAGLPIRAMSRITNVFVADDQYELNCQYTPKATAMITAACNEMLRTLSTGR
ncbi:MAG TPA: hypothetical protein VGH24_02055 [Solirubrobacteraceae bacterium]